MPQDMTFEVLEGAEKGKVIGIPVDGGSIGRKATIVITDRRAEDFHAQLEVVDGQFVLKDLASTAGTFVNGKQIREQVLKLNDIVTIGSTRLALVNTTAIAPVASIPARAASSNTSSNDSPRHSPSSPPRLDTASAHASSGQSGSVLKTESSGPRLTIPVLVMVVLTTATVCLLGAFILFKQFGGTDKQPVQVSETGKPSVVHEASTSSFETQNIQPVQQTNVQPTVVTPEPPKPEPAAPFDPASSFETFCRAFANGVNAHRGVKFYNEMKNREQSNSYKISSPTFDVRQTNSLVSPYIGTLDFECQTFVNGEASGRPSTRTFTFAWQKTQWVLSKALQHNTAHDFDKDAPKWIDISAAERRIVTEVLNAVNK